MSSFDPNKNREYLKSVWRCNEEIGLAGNYIVDDGDSVADIDLSTSVEHIKGVSWDEASTWLKANPIFTTQQQSPSVNTGGKRSRSNSSGSNSPTKKDKNNNYNTQKEAKVEGKLYLVNADCVNVAYALQDAGFNPLITNAGSRDHFGGGYANGARAQEEELCRRSLMPFAGDERYNPDLIQPLVYPGAPMGVKANRLYPLPPSDAIYTPSVPFIRLDGDSRYKLLKDGPRYLDVITVAAHNIASPRGRVTTPSPATVIADTNKYFTTLLTAGIMNGHDSVVIVPIGCGAFGNPPAMVANSLLQVIESGEFLARYSAIVVACLDDHNTGQFHNPNGNFAPFRNCFEGSRTSLLSSDKTPYNALSQLVVHPHYTSYNEDVGITKLSSLFTI